MTPLININGEKIFHQDVKFKDGNIFINNKKIKISVNKEEIKDISPLGKQYLISLIKQIGVETLKNTSEILVNQHDIIIKNNLKEIKLDKINNINLIYKNLIQKKQAELFFSDNLWKKTNLNRKEIDKKVFVQLHNSHRILNTNYEGNINLNNIKEMQFILSMLFQDPRLSEKEKKIINQTMGMMKERAPLAEKMNSAKNSSEVYVDLLSKLKNNESVYLPSGWSAKNGGHAVVIKFFKEGDKISYYIINKGDGADRHPILKATEMGQTKYDIRSVKHQMSLKDFEASKGRALIDALYTINQPQGKRNGGSTHEFSYCAEDLYGICLYYATEIEDNQPLPSFASVNQVSGNCTQASLNASLLDEFLKKGLSPNEIQRMFFLIKHKSFQMACEDWMKEIEKHPDNQLILRDAAQQHLMRIQKLIPHDQKDAFIKEGSLLAQAILQKLDNLKEKKETFKLDSLNSIQISEQKKEEELPCLFSEGVEAKKTNQQYSIFSKTVEKPKTQREACMLLISSIILSRSALSQGQNSVQLFVELTNILRLMPLSHEKNHLGSPFWSGMNSSQATATLESLNSLTEQMLRSGRKIFKLNSLENTTEQLLDLDIERMNEAMAIAYDIGVALAEQIDGIGEHLKKYPITGPEKLLKKIRKKNAKETLTQILLNFKERNKGKDLKKGKIFPSQFLVSNNKTDLNHAHYDFISDLYGYDNIKKMEIYETKVECFHWAAYNLLNRKDKSYKNLQDLFIKAQGIKKDYLKSEYFLYSYELVENSEKEGLYSLTKIKELSDFKNEDYILHPKQIFQADNDLSLENFENTLLVKNPKVESIKNIDLSSLRELALMEFFSDTAVLQTYSWAKENLSFLQTFSWAKENLSLLNHPYVKYKIYKNLFSTSNLTNILREQVSRELIQEFLKNALDFYKQSDSPETYLWILEIANSLTLVCQKEGIKCDFGNPFSEVTEMLKSFQINQMGWNIDDKKNIAACYLAFSQQKPLEDPSSFAKAFFFYHHPEASSRVKRIYSKATQAILKHHKSLFQELGKMKEDQLKSLVLEILSSRGIAIKNQTLSCHYDPKKGIYYGDYLLNFKGEIEKEGMQISYLPSHFKTSRLYQAYFSQGECSPMLIDEEGYYLDDSKNLRLLPDEEGDLELIEKKICVRKGDENWYRFIPQSEISKIKDPSFNRKEDVEDILLSTYPSLPPTIFKNPNQVFIEVNTSSSPRIVILGPNQMKYVVEMKEGLFFIKAIYPNGEERRVVPLNSLTETSCWRKWLGEIEEPLHVLIEQEEKNEEVAQIHFPRLGLHFEKKGKHFFCQEMPGFFLKENQSLPFDHYKGCLVLENEKKEVKTLIPFHPFKKEEKPKNCAMQFDVNVDLETINEKIPYFIYKNQHDGSLRADSPQGALYLAVLYRTEKNYEKAVFQIQQSETYRGNIKLDYTIAKFLEDQPDQSPEGIAFDLQFYYRLKNHHRKFTTKDKSLRALQKQIDKKTETLVYFYKNMSSDKVDSLYSIPVSLRLSKKQKKLLGMYETEEKIRHKYEEPWKFSYLTQTNSFDLLKDLETAQDYQQKAMEFLRISEKKNWKSKLKEAPEFNPHDLRPAGLNYTYEEVLDPIDFYLTERTDDILEALSKPEQKDLVLRHLLFISRYPNLTTQPLLELLLAACHFKPEELTSLLKEEKGIPRIVALIKMNKNKKPTRLDVSRFVLQKEKLEKTIETQGIIKDREIKKRIKFEEADYSKMAAFSEYRSNDGIRDLIAPMQKFLQDHQFQVEEKVKNDYPPFLFNQETIEKTLSPLAKKRMIQLNQALERLKQKKERIYSSKSGVATMKKEVEEKQRESQFKAESYRAYALEIANRMVDKKNLELRGGLQLKKLTLKDLKNAYLKQNGTKLVLENPELNQERIQEIFTLMMEADLAACQEKQCREMLPLFDSLLDKKSTQEKIAQNMQSLGEIANRHFQLKDLAKYPQFSVFAAETGLWPRPDQIEVIDWFLEKLRKGEGVTMSQILERSAGFGKSKVFLAIVAQIAAQRGYSVSIYTTPNLIDFIQEDISSSSKEAFDQNFETVNWKVGETHVTKELLQSLLEQLQEWKKAGHPILKTPETWHLINIAHKKAKFLKDPELEKVTNQIICFFDNGLSLVDEGHLNLNPLTEVNQVIGEKSMIPKNQLEELIANYDLLLKIKELGIKENTQSVVTSDMIKKAQKALILNIIEREPYQTINKTQLKQWLEEPFGGKEPHWLEKILETNAPLFDLIEMQHRFIQSLFPYLMQQRGKLDYGENPKTDQFYATPRKEGTKTTSSYQDEYLTASLTIQMLAQEGLSIESFKKMIHHLIQEHQREYKNQFNRTKTSVEKRLESLLGNPIPFTHLAIDNEKQIQNLYLKLKNHSGFHQWYFKEIIHSQIEIYKEKISSTPAEFLSRLGFSLLLSATPGSKASYPLLVQKQENHQEDDEAIAHDLAQMIHHRNRQIIELEPFDHPKKFFDQIEEKIGNENMNQIQLITDRGGIFRNVDHNSQVLEGLKENRKANNKGIVRPGIAVTTDPNMGRNAQFFRYRKDQVESVILPGSDLESAMKKAGQSAEELKDAVYFASIQETTGTDWKLPDQCKVIFTIGERLSLGDADQAIKRDRKLSRKEHAFVWVVTKEVAKSIPHTKDLQPEDIINWLVVNEAEEEAKKIAMRFVQGIEQILISHKPKATGLSNAMLTSTANLSPSQSYQEKKEIAQFKDRYIGQIIQNLKKIYPNDKRLNAQTIQTIEDLEKLALLEKREINDLKKLIDYTKEAMGSDPSVHFNQKNLSAEQVVEKGEIKEQEQLVEQVALQEQVAQSSEGQKNLEPKSEIYVNYVDGLSSIELNNEEDWYQLNKICKWPQEVKGPPLYLSNKFLHVYKDSDNQNFVIRPISNLLVVMNEDEEGNYHNEYIALSQLGTIFYQNQLKNAERVEGKKFAIVSPFGDLLMTQTNDELSQKEIQNLKESDSLKQALTLVALAKGQIKGDKETLKTVFGSCLAPQFEQLEKQVKKHLIEGVAFEGGRYEKMKFLFLSEQKTKSQQKIESLKETKPQQKTESLKKTKPQQKIESLKETKFQQKIEFLKEIKFRQKIEFLKKTKPQQKTESLKETKSQQKTESLKETKPQQETKSLLGFIKAIFSWIGSFFYFWKQKINF